MLHHPDADRTIEGSTEPTVVAQLNLHIESATPAFRKLLLCARNRQANHGAAVLFGCIFREAAPAAADIEEPQAGAKLQPLADHLQFAPLGGREIITLLITSARILHPGIEHGLEEI